MTLTHLGVGRRWIIPALTIICLAAIAVTTWLLLNKLIHEKQVQDLTTILRADVEALRVWMKGHQNNATILAQDDEIRARIVNLAQGAELPEGEGDESRYFGAVCRQFGYTGYAVILPTGRVIAARDPGEVGYVFDTTTTDFVQRALRQGAVVSRPFLMETEESPSRAVMYTAASVVNEDHEPVAVLAFRIQPEKDFTTILEVARSGETGETYAFDRDGCMLSHSRFTDSLAQTETYRGLESSVLKVSIRDPGVDLTKGRVPGGDAQPLTAMAESAIQAARRGEPEGWIDYNVDGYRDYRGARVIGAWTWLPDQGFGVATEVDYVEAYAPRLFLREMFGFLFALVAAGAAGIVIYNRTVARLQGRVKRAQRQIEQLGQYHLDEKIGQGGMGEVYRASHAFLRRPTAVKLLRPDRSTEEAIARFEREVQLTSQLTHPNTIAIYDYGRTRENVFYYAMEFLSGADLNDAIRFSGAMPEGRVIKILNQVCGSLAEAHAQGLIHRDVKPANIILCQRGGMDDFVKVLDFGLVKDISTPQQVQLSMENVLTGTPLYMSPEAITKPDEIDSRSDLYLVGAVGYFLLTGTNVFDGQSAFQVCGQHLSADPEPPSQRLGREVDADLEQLLLKCLRKSPDQRPQTAREIAQAVQTCQSADAWTAADARRWWEEYDRASKLPEVAPATGVGPVHDKTIAIDTAKRDAAAAEKNAPPTILTEPKG